MWNRTRSDGHALRLEADRPVIRTLHRCGADRCLCLGDAFVSSRSPAAIYCLDVDALSRPISAHTALTAKTLQACTLGKAYKYSNIGLGRSAMSLTSLSRGTAPALPVSSRYNTPGSPGCLDDVHCVLFATPDAEGATYRSRRLLYAVNSTVKQQFWRCPLPEEDVNLAARTFFSSHLLIRKKVLTLHFLFTHVEASRTILVVISYIASSKSRMESNFIIRRVCSNLQLLYLIRFFFIKQSYFFHV